jgi:hypothetical protein
LLPVRFVPERSVYVPAFHKPEIERKLVDPEIVTSPLDTTELPDESAMVEKPFKSRELTVSVEMPGFTLRVAWLLVDTPWRVTAPPPSALLLAAITVPAETTVPPE